ncbi:MAG: Eco57I restriction-modification methylase domain-containing protein [Phycisphaerales bacterium]
MIDPAQIESALRRVNNQSSFVQELLIDALGWPIDEAAQEIGDIAYEWTEDELRAAGLNEAIVGGKAYQIILPGNPWGIFVMEFANPDVFITGRGMTGVLRRVLHGLIRKGRGGQSSNLPRFTQDNLLFICNHNYQRYRFAHFKPAPEGGGTPPMASFGWGPDDLEAVRTICEFNLRALEWPDSPPTTEAEWLKTWQPAFDVEKVTKRFYQDYAQVFHRVEDIIRRNTDVAGDELRMFTQSLFNRLMFLRFIERKGWLVFPGQAGSRYLAALASAGGIGKRSLYASRLRPLFFQGLAEEGKQESDAYGMVPLLNGGLFEESNLDARVSDIPDDAFALIMSQGGLFYRYNFTVEESTPLDIEVAVDPEMLGKVFEELVTGRHESGSYYTPRPVVAFMCREALKGHLADRTGAPESAIATLVDDHEVEGLTEAHASAIIGALDDLKAVDPACGSGAYLLGLLQELIAIRRALQSERLAADPGFLYDLKLHIISHNLYGVDIDPFATEIAKLRLWLSLAVEADHPVPLPNLDFKIETGDSLLGPNPQHAELLHAASIHSLADTTVESKLRYVDARGDEKEDLRREIERNLDDIRRLLNHKAQDGVVDWRVQFAEVFQANGGFDIALANPPYVRQELITSYKPALKECFPDVYTGAADLYVYFYDRGIHILRDGGHLSYIAPNKFFRATYGAKLRIHLLQKTELSSLIDFADYPIFQAITYPAIVVTKKCSSARSDAQVRVHNWDHADALDRLSQVIAENARVIPQSDLLGDAWRIINSDAAGVLGKLRTTGFPLATVVGSRFYRGIVTGYNKAFEIDASTREQLIAADPNCASIIKPWIRGKNVRRWHVEYDNKYLIYAHWSLDIELYPSIKRHLEQFKDKLESRPECRAGRFNWWCLSRYGSEYAAEYDKPKIFYKVISTYQEIAYAESSAVSNDKTWFIPSPPAGLLAYLNSKVAWFFLDQVAPKLQGGAFELRSPAMSQVPVPRLSETLSELESKAIAAASRSDEDGDLPELERAIDDEVVGLFGLSAKEVRIVDEAIEAAGNRFPKRFRESEAYQRYVAEMFGED